MNSGLIPGKSGQVTVNAATPSTSDEAKPTSHAEALRSTSIMGGSMVIVMLIRMIRTKVLALLLGPAGIGLEAIFDSVLGLARAVVSSGISNSGVRQIAAAVGSGDQQAVATTAITLRRLCLLLGALGAITLLLARESISRLAFGHADHASDIAWLAIIPLLGGIASSHGALIHGMRQIGDLARMNIFAALASTVFSLPIVWVWGKEGIPAYLILSAVVGLFVAWRYARRLPVAPVEVPLRQTVREARTLLELGLVFVSSGLMMTGVLFLLRALVTRQEGMEGVGQFQAANALSMVYVSFVLQAMGTDFYPRLTAVANDNKRCNQLVNEQAEISLLLALPGVLATLALAPWVIRVFYSSKFDMAAEILCWQVTGMLLRVNSWPMGFIALAKGRGATIFWTDFAAYSAYAGFGWLGLQFFGLPGVGMAFVGLYIFHWCMLYLVVRRMSGFRWSSNNVRLSLIALSTAIVALSTRLIHAEPWSTIVGCLLAALAGIFCLKTLIRLIGVEKTNHYLRKIRVPFQFRKPAPTAPEAGPVAAA